MNFLKIKLFIGLLIIISLKFSTISFGQQWLFFPTGIPKNWLNIGDLNVTGDSITIEALISLPDLSTNPAKNIVSKHTGVVNCNYLLRHWRFELTTTSGYTSVTNPVSFCLDSVYHVAATYDGDSVKYYVNGIEVASKHWTGDLVQNSFAAAIGNISEDGPNEQFFGYIDEVRIWRIARSQTEIANYLYDLPNPTSQYGLLAYYKFEGNYNNVQGNPAYNGVPMGTQLKDTINPYFYGTVSYPPVDVSITIIVSNNSVCAGDSVDFTAIPQNGGDSPIFQWKVNGTNVGTNSPTFTYRPFNGDIVTCVLTSSFGCTTNNPATSNPIIMIVNNSYSVSVSISSSFNPVCSGTPVTFTATPINGGIAPSYQWQVNSINSGTNLPTFTYTPLNGDIVTCILASSLLLCVFNNPDTSNAISMVVYPILQVDVSISSSENPVCIGNTVTLNATPINGGTNPIFQWKVNGIDAGTNSSVYSYIPSNNDLVSCILTSSDTSCITNNPDTSNTITMAVIPLLPVSVSIQASANPSCQDSSVIFTATPINEGTNPIYQWKVNGIDAGTNSSVYSYIPSNNDLVSCILTSSELCTSNNPSTSNTIAIIVNDNVPAGVLINASNNPFCPGTTVNFLATSVNGGIYPSYQWKVNGINTGTDSPSLTYSPQPGDSVWCIMTSNLICITGNPATSEKINMVAFPAPLVTFTRCFDSITINFAKPFQLKGGLPLGGIYSGPGVNSSTGIFTPSVAGTGIKIFTYSYTNTYLCSASNTISITVLDSPTFNCGNNLTDIRDGKVYRTIQVGSKCWMGANLNYGSWIHSSNHQIDNCIPEKYCPNDLQVTCQMGTATYQWDELIQYGITLAPDYQGVCPPGWHIPSAADFQELINAFQGSSLAGTFLKDMYLIPRGFEAMLQGMAYLNTAWAFTSSNLPAGSLFWTSTIGSANKVITRGVNSRNQSVSMYESSKANAFPVRCVKD